MLSNETYSTHAFRLLPEPERRPAPFITSAVVNLVILALAFYIGVTAERVLDQRHYEQSILFVPSPQPPALRLKPPMSRIVPPKPLAVKLQEPSIRLPKIEAMKEPKTIQMEARLNVPVLKDTHPAVVLAPQPKAALVLPSPAQAPDVKASTTPVLLGDPHGVVPNPNASRAAIVAALGSPYGASNGAASLGVVGSTGLGNGDRLGSNGYGGAQLGKVAAAGIAAATPAAVSRIQTLTSPSVSGLEVLSKPPVQYTSEARQLKVQGDVILRVTFTANGQVIVQQILHGLGHGLDEEARRVAQEIRYRPATHGGHAIDITTTITISFQLA